MTEIYDIWGGSVFTPMKVSMMTVAGTLTDTPLHEINDFKQFHLVKGVITGFENKLQKVEDPEDPIIKKKNTKSTILLKSNNKSSERSNMHSMIQFHIRSCTQSNRKFKIKVFRGGNFQLPGTKCLDYSDAMPSLTILRDYLSEFYPKGKIEITKLGYHLLNFMFELKNVYYRINVVNLSKYLDAEYKDVYLTADLNSLMKYVETLTRETIPSEENFYMWLRNSRGTAAFNVGSDIINTRILYNSFQLNKSMDEIRNDIINAPLSRLGFYSYKDSNNPQVYMLIKTPNKDHLYGTTTLVVLPSGKVNIKGAVDEKNSKWIYEWLSNLLDRYHKQSEDPDRCLRMQSGLQGHLPIIWTSDKPRRNSLAI